MAITVRFTVNALEDLESTFEFISLDNQGAAKKTIAQILEGLEQLKKFPDSGRVGRRRGTRELVISNLPYVIVYRINESTLEVLAVLHTSRKWL